MSKLLTMDEVIARVRLSRSTIYRRIKDGSFPAPLDLSENRIGWQESDISTWLDTRLRRGRVDVVRLPVQKGEEKGLERAI